MIQARLQIFVIKLWRLEFKVWQFLLITIQWTQLQLIEQQQATSYIQKMQMFNKTLDFRRSVLIAINSCFWVLPSEPFCRTSFFEWSIRDHWDPSTSICIFSRTFCVKWTLFNICKLFWKTYIGILSVLVYKKVLILKSTRLNWWYHWDHHECILAPNDHLSTSSEFVVSKCYSHFNVVNLTENLSSEILSNSHRC